MKVLHLNDFYSPIGGAETILFQTLDALDESGIENVMVYEHPSSDVSSLRCAHRIPGLNVMHASSAARNAFEKIVSDEAPDLIHLYGFDNPEIVEASLPHAPTVRTVMNHNLYCPGGLKYLPSQHHVCTRSLGLGCLTAAYLTNCNTRRPLRLWTSFARARQARHLSGKMTLLPLSHYQQDRLVESGYDPALIRLLPPFTNLPKVTAAPAASTLPLILFAGRVVRLKGADLLLRAVAQIKSPWRLVIAGDGAEQSALQKLTGQLQLTDRVEFAGWANRKQLDSLYARAAVIVVPSVWPEPFGMVGIEAMSHAKPVVAFHVGGIPDWLEDGKNGFLIPPHDVTRMSEKIEQLLQNPQQAQEMGQCGRIRVEREFSLEKHLTKLLAIYQEVIHARIKPVPVTP